MATGRFIAVLLACALTFAQPVAAETAADVGAAFNDYQAALDAGDADAARAAAKAAYEAAEDVWGSSRAETAILASNYARIVESQREAHRLFNRCIAILTEMPDADVVELAYCHYHKGKLFEADGNAREALEQFEAATIAAEPFADADREAAYIAGLAYLSRASLAVDDQRGFRDRTLKRQRDLAMEAERLLELSGRGDTAEAGIATLMQGYFSEFEEEWLDAYELYVAARERICAAYGDDDDWCITAKGRARFMSALVEEENRKERARAENVREGCQLAGPEEEPIEVCWIERKAPHYPMPGRPGPVPGSVASWEKVGRGGFVMLRFTVTRDGSLANLEIADSWPGEPFDSATLKAVETWRAHPPVGPGGEPIDVPNVETFVRFILAD